MINNMGRKSSSTTAKSIFICHTETRRCIKTILINILYFLKATNDLTNSIMLIMKKLQ